MVVGRDRHQGLGTTLSQKERIRQQSRSSGTMPLNNPRLLIRLRTCRKSGTVPLNSPRLLIRHWIPSTGLHTDQKLSYKRSLYPARHRLTTQYKHQVLWIRVSHDLYGRRKSGGLNRSATQGTRRLQSRPKVPLLTIIQQGLYPRVQPIISIKPIISWLSKHRPEHSFNKFNIAT